MKKFDVLVYHRKINTPYLFASSKSPFVIRVVINNRFILEINKQSVLKYVTESEIIRRLNTGHGVNEINVVENCERDIIMRSGSDIINMYRYVITINENLLKTLFWRYDEAKNI